MPYLRNLFCISIRNFRGGITLPALLFFLVLFQSEASIYAQFQEDRYESKVKAAYIYRIIKFVYWNSAGKNLGTRKNPIKISVLGSDIISEQLKTFSQIPNMGLSISVRKADVSNSDLNKCHLLYISKDKKQQLPSILRLLEGAKVLTISDIDSFAYKGGMMGFIMGRNKVNIEINPLPVKKSGIKLSAKLLEVVKIVKPMD